MPNLRNLFEHDEQEDVTYKLDSRETYLFSNCTRHADTLGVILGTPLACIAKLLVQRTFPGVSTLGIVLGVCVPTLLASYVTVSSLYVSSTCWDYLRLLPEGSVFRELLTEAERQHNTRSSTFNRVRAVQDVMMYQAAVDNTNYDVSEIEYLSRDEIHDIQKELRWVPKEEYRLPNRIRQYTHSRADWDYIRESLRTYEKNMHGAPPILKDEQLKNAAKALPRIKA